MNDVPPFQLTLSAVKRGYAESGLKPCKGCFVSTSGDSCCPFSAAAFAYYGRIDWVTFAEDIGMTREQMESYWMGVDGKTLFVQDPEYWRLGQEHAKALGL